jgi:L-malate glycosyltransferase
MIPTIVFVWSNFGPYHIDRLEAATIALSGKCRVVGIEMSGMSSTYGWERSSDASGFERVTLFPDERREAVPVWRRFSTLAQACFRLQAQHIFLCNYDRVETLALAALLRVAGRRVYLMIDSKLDDKPRQIWREALKAIFYLPYRGALAAGQRAEEYLRFHGFRASRIVLGYDTVSVARIRRLANAPPAPQGPGFRERHFTIVARLIPKKNIAMALEAYAQHCRQAGPGARELHICGSGLLEPELRRQAEKLGLTRLVFHGFLQASEIAGVLASTLALILPSTEEQWGLVVNEALAMGVPILCSFNVGARDLLVRTAVNGYAFEPDNPAGLARLMSRLGEDETEWRQLAEGSLRLAPLADSRHFAAAVGRLIGIGGTETHALDRPSIVDAPP